MELKFGHPLARPAFALEVRRSHLYALVGGWAIFWDWRAGRPVVSREDRLEGRAGSGDENKLSTAA